MPRMAFPLREAVTAVTAVMAFPLREVFASRGGYGGYGGFGRGEEAPAFERTNRVGWRHRRIGVW